MGLQVGGQDALTPQVLALVAVGPGPDTGSSVLPYCVQKKGSSAVLQPPVPPLRAFDFLVALVTKLLTLICLSEICFFFMI